MDMYCIESNILINKKIRKEYIYYCTEYGYLLSKKIRLIGTLDRIKELKFNLTSCGFKGLEIKRIKNDL